MEESSSIKPIISVIVPVYNQEKYIGRCLRSLMSQTMRQEDFEIIVINDGSNDKSAYALELFREDITIISNDSNLGLLSCLNLGIRKSKGSYIVRVDSDDFVNTNFLNFLNFFLEYNSYADAVACD